MFLGSFFYVIFFIGSVEVRFCPSTEDITPCRCDTIYRGIRFVCKNIFIPEELIAPMRVMEKSKANVNELLISYSSLMYLPDNIFKNTGIIKVVIDRTELMSLSESGTAFDGLEEDLMEIRASDIGSASHWDFEQLRNLKKLNKLRFWGAVLRSVDQTFPYLPELWCLEMITCETYHIIDGAFSNLEKLAFFKMDGNKITEMKRNMFPNPANSLSTISLARNSLSTLPADFFENMPNLRYVYLQVNKFVTLSEKPFSQAIRYIKELLMSDNPFRCDCRMHWLVNIRLPEYFVANCSTPKSLSRRSLRDLDLKSLWC